MEFHPSKIPIAKTFKILDEKGASEAAEEIVKMGFSDRKDGFKVLMPKEKKLAKTNWIHHYNKCQLWFETN